MRSVLSEKMKCLVTQFYEQQAEGVRLDAAKEANLESLGFGAKDAI